MATRAPNRRAGYGLVLLLVAASAIVQMAVSGAGAGRLVSVVLQAATLVAAVRAAGATRTAVRVAALAGVAIAAASLVALAIDGSVPRAPAAIVSALLVAIAPAVIATGLHRSLVVNREVTLHTLAGVLAVYLLAGMTFSFVYASIAAIDAGALFAGVASPTQSDELYFSFVTLCTVGYGDLTPATDVTRSVAVAEMLLGQIYLVTVVAVIVSQLARAR